jgi:hypothetical protein
MPRRIPYLVRHTELLETEVTAKDFAKQYSRPVVGVAAYLVAALAGWLIHPSIAIVIFVLMIVYHAWTSHGTRTAHRGQAGKQGVRSFPISGANGNALS